MRIWSNSRTVEVVCWILGAVLILAFFGARTYGELERQWAVEAFAEARVLARAQAVAAIPPPHVSTGPGEVGENFEMPRESMAAHLAPDQTQWSLARIRAHLPGAEDSAVPVSLPLAVLRIGNVRLEVPVYPDTTERNLNRGAGLIEGTALPDSDGNIGIAAHRDGYFRALKDVNVGDLLELESLSQTRAYRVTELFIVEPTDIWPLYATDDPSVTLVTCYPFYFVGSAPQRFIVRAEALEF
jgi:sortase A